MTTLRLQPTSLCAFFANAIERYQMAHYGNLPSAIEITPNLFDQFRTEPLMQFAYYNQDQIQWKDLKWHGVKILPVIDAEYPRIIGHLGDVDFL